MKRARLAWIVTGVAAIALGVARGASAPPWPDDWDGIGFVESIAHFDLARFTPHAPGYPVYVAMLKLASIAIADPIAAANAVGVACGVIAPIVIAWAAARAFDSPRAIAIGLMVSIAPLAWRSGSAIGSESPALAFAAIAALGATFVGRRAAWIVGACIGLGLGVRLSWAPLFLALVAVVPRGERARASGVALLASLAWAIPFVLVVGPARLVGLAHAHAAGHFTSWGGTAITDSGIGARAAFFGRDLFADGLGAGRDPLGLAIAIATLASLALALRAWRARGWTHAKVALLFVPYAAWIAIGQNLRAQPRHALPLVVAITAALGVSFFASRASRVVGVILFALIAARTSLDAHARRTIPPPGAQLVALAESSASSVAVFGGPSARFFEIDPSPRVFAQSAGSLGDARLALGRLPSLPPRVLVTSELEDVNDVPPRRDLRFVTTLCRPARIDRRAPCLDVYDWRPIY